MAKALELAVYTVLGPVPVYFLLVYGSFFSYMADYVLHWLFHRAKIGVRLIVLEEFARCRLFFVLTVFFIYLFLVEVIVFHEGLNAFVFKVGVVFIASIACVGL